MKLAIATAFLVASTGGFTTPKDSVRTTTELYKYRPTKWTPQQGATHSATSSSPVLGGAPASPAAFEAAPTSDAAALQYGGMPKSVASAGPKSDYSGVKWSPQGGSNPTWGAPSAVSVAAAAAPVEEAAPVGAMQYGGMPKTIATGPKTDYSGVKWSPQGGSNPTWGAPAAAAAAPAGAMEYGGMPKAVAAAGAGPKSDYSGVKWSPQGGSNPNWGSAPAIESAYTAAAIAAEPEVAEPQAPPAPAGPTMADLQREWAAMNSDHESLGQPQMAVAAAPVAAAAAPPAPAGPTMADLQKEWAAMNSS